MKNILKSLVLFWACVGYASDDRLPKVPENNANSTHAQHAAPANAQQENAVLDDPHSFVDRDNVRSLVVTKEIVPARLREDMIELPEPPMISMIVHAPQANHLCSRFSIEQIRRSVLPRLNAHDGGDSSDSEDSFGNRDILRSALNLRENLRPISQTFVDRYDVRPLGLGIQRLVELLPPEPPLSPLFELPERPVLDVPQANYSFPIFSIEPLRISVFPRLNVHAHPGDDSSDSEDSFVDPNILRSVLFNRRGNLRPISETARHVLLPLLDQGRVDLVLRLIGILRNPAHTDEMEEFYRQFVREERTEVRRRAAAQSDE